MRKKYGRLDRAGLAALLKALDGEHYQTFGPRRGEHAIEWLPIATLDDLPGGWTTDTAPSSYRLRETGAAELFHYWTGPDSLKKLLHPSCATITRSERSNGDFHVWNEHPVVPKRAFFGARACDLASVAALDRVLLDDRFEDDIYKAHRQNTLFVAVHCTDCAPTCFCASMGAGPRATAGFDIALEERPGGTEYLTEPGTPAGAALLEKAGVQPAPPEWAAELAERCARAAATQTRRLDATVAAAAIEAGFDHPRWEQTAARCLACGNCTSACPTCFCVNFEDHTLIDPQVAERRRLWDSCFTQSFTYIHGGSLRLSPKARYRHWLSHKLARWQQQFSMPGCVGCGRCITWCPAAIDITEECAALMK
jgi:ferredoxin